MKSHTYYDVLGVSRDATLEEITNAKNALAKVYHPDANAHKDIDTTAFMQEILEAYQVLSDPEKRKAYNHDTFGETAPRVFRTFKVGPDGDSKDESSSFVTYWNAASRLNETLRRSMRLMEKESQKKSISHRFFRKIGNKNAEIPDEYRSRQIAKLSMEAVQYITTLKMAGIPMQYWHSDAMNWVLVRWGQKQDTDYHILFSRYAAYVEKNKSSSEKLKLRSYNRQFHNNLKKLLSYSLEA
ncbi:DnaJ domain-containing protein [Mediterraneibacter glycyrrhizinilyticus]|uniref:DnaJ domain-containing protein n=1 Tax=Mediterraneibacter glycyrrhizinilyticus TaxID=342942 RepID=UPI0019613139|nr:DnaJ domain-containing protein [Mediterraneibacter glycyrrhizinilyticus]MBM6751891.1 DnaJ domain-containing protein [Mediterraneibacter glycyrrhizinilyticus]